MAKKTNFKTYLVMAVLLVGMVELQEIAQGCKKWGEIGSIHADVFPKKSPQAERVRRTEGNEEQ